MSETRQANNHVVYLLEEFGGTWVKVGACGSVYDRVRTLNQGRPLNDLVCDVFLWCEEGNNLEVEALIHDKMAKAFPCNREWFCAVDKELFVTILMEILENVNGITVVHLDKKNILRGKRGEPMWRHYPKHFEEHLALVEAAKQ